MPNRWITMLIIAFWLTMMTWLTVKEGLARLNRQPSLASALSASAKDGPSHWSVMQNGKKLGTATTQVTINDRGHYELLQNVQLDHFPGESFLNEQLTFRLLNRAEVNSDGVLQRFHWDVTFGGEKDPFRWKLDAAPDKDQLKLTVTGKPLDGEYKLPYDGRAMVMSSLCPLDRMPDIQLGKSWESPMIDPIGTTASRVLERPAMGIRVLDTPQKLDWNKSSHSCYLVEGRQPNMSVRIWVRQRDFLVLKQTATWGSTTLELVRDGRSAKKMTQ